MGYSLASAAFAVIAATVPDQPAAPVTSFVNDRVQITWTLPSDGGSAINRYTVKVRQADGVTFSETGAYCDGATLTVINTRTCLIPISVLTSSPFNLPWGTSVWAVIQARNIIGESLFSEAGNGSIILVVPDAPINLANLPKITNAYQVGLQWQAGVSDGGSPVTEYIVLSNGGNEGALFTPIKTGVLATTMTIAGLTPGLTY